MNAQLIITAVAIILFLVLVLSYLTDDKTPKT
jgi:hypothetical protein